MEARVAQGALTSIGIRIRIMQLERDPLYKVSQIICSPHSIRVGHRGGAPYGDGPPVGMIGMRELVPLFLGQCPRSVSIDDRTVYCHSLGSTHSKKWQDNGNGEMRTRTRTRSLEAMANAVEASRAAPDRKLRLRLART